ncbi:MAG: autotransporter outer membrane beta-barrel domain-containing protein [Methylococcaceae bacterium]|nr:autotransporter outer membrane beta-barrel domain-containing protein [Methylococcaceae bacterium]
MILKRSYFAVKALTGMVLLTGYSQLAVAVQMFVSPSNNNNVTLSFFPNANETLSDLNNIVCPGGVVPSIKPGTTVSSCEVPNNGTDQYRADYRGTAVDGRLQITPNLELPDESIKQAFAEACRGASEGSALATRCQEGFADANAAASAMAPSQVTAQVGQIIKISGSQVRNVRMRLNAVQRGIKNPLSLDINGKKYQLNGGGAGDETDVLQDGRIGVFMNGRFQTADKKQTGFEAGFNSENFGVTAGVDYRFLDNLVMGLAFGYDNTDTTMNKGNQEINAFTGMFYGNYNLAHDMFIDWAASYSDLGFDAQRTISYVKANNTVFNGVVKGAPNANEYNLNAGFGKNFALGAWLFTPHVRFDYIELNIDGYKEQGQGQDTGLELQYKSQVARSITSTAGASVAYAVSTPWGVLTPEVSFDWQHEFLNDATKIFGSLANVNNVLVARSNAPDRDYFNLSGSIVGTFAEGRSIFLSYEARLGQSTIASHLVQLGFRIPF